MFSRDNHWTRNLKFLIISPIIVAAFWILFQPAANAAVNGGGHYVVAGSSATYGDVVVWADSRFGARQIYYKTLPDGVETRLSAGSVHQSNPAVYGNTVVWSESGNLYYKDIYLDLPDGPPHALTANPEAPKSSPQIFGDLVVWQQTDGSVTRIYGKRLTDSGNGAPLNPDNAYNQSSPAVYGDYVVWVSNPVGGGTYDLKFKNLATGTVGNLCTAANDQTRPAIYGTVVAWEDGRDGVPGLEETILPQVYFYDLAAGAPADPAAAGTRLSATAGRQSRPAVVGTSILWLDARGGETGTNNVYRSLIGGAETQITIDGLNRDNPSIHTNLIYEEQPAGFYGSTWDIISAASPAPGALAGITVTPASASLKPDQKQNFFAQGHDASNNPVTAVFDWAATGGAASPASGDSTVYTAGVTYGDFTVTASSGAISSAPSAINISPAPLDHITITGPDEAIAGGTADYGAQGYDASGDPIDGLTYTWTASGGSVPETGASVTYSAPTASGDYQLNVSATSSGIKTASKSVSITPGPFDHIDVSPDAAFMAAGTSAAFSAQGQDAYHNNISGLTYNWSALSGGLNPATGSSTTYTTPESGSADTITVTSGDKTTTVAITLAYLDRIVVSPASATIPAGGGRSFTATGYDQFDNEMTGIVFDWTATGGTTEPGAGAATVYTAGTTPGAGYYVRASAFEKSADADITVTAGALDRIALSPDTATLTPAAGQVFTADGFDAWDNQISGLTFTWTATGGTVAPTIGGSTTFTAGAAPGASYYVRAASGTVFSDAAVTVTTGPLHRITVSPNSARLSIGASGIFTAQGYDAFNNPISNLTYTWTSTSGTVNPVTGSSTTFFAGTASGMTMVSAANGSITGSAWCSIASKIGVLYDYGNGRARLWSMDASGPGADEPLMAWFWNGGFDASRAKITSGDYNEDGKEEIGILYDYGNGRARLWSMDASGPGADEPLMAWFWNGGFDAARAKITSGDYNGDGTSEIGILYDYGNGRARLWSMDASGPGADEPLMAWFWNGGFDATRAKITSGDYNEDGKDEIGVLYDYGNNQARLWSMDASGPGADEPLMAWFWNGGFDASRAKITSGDYNEDGKEEIGILYDYGNGRARLWSMDASGPGADEPLMAWFWNGGFDAARAKVE